MTILTMFLSSLLAHRIGPQPAGFQRELSAGDECGFTATAYDAQGIVIPEGVGFAWELLDDVGIVERLDGHECSIRSQQAGQVTVRVTATQGESQAGAEVTVKFFEKLSNKEKDASKGLPSYRPEAATDELRQLELPEEFDRVVAFQRLSQHFRRRRAIRPSTVKLTRRGGQFAQRRGRFYELQETAVIFGFGTSFSWRKSEPCSAHHVFKREISSSTL